MPPSRSPLVDAVKQARVTDPVTAREGLRAMLARRGPGGGGRKGMSDPVEAGEEKRVTHWNASEMEASGAWAEKRRLAAAMRVVIERLMTSDAPEGELRAAADALERYAERLAKHPRADRYFGFAESANAGNVLAFFDQSPIIGRANPIAPPVVMREEGGRVVGTARFGSAYEGPPGCVHGG